MRGHGQKLTGKQEALIAALLTESTHAAAATKAGLSEATVYRWLQLPEFLDAYRQARRQLVEGAVGRIQAAAGQAVKTLLTVATTGAKDSDRVRAAAVLLDHACRGLELSQWAEKAEVSGRGGGPITTAIIIPDNGRARKTESEPLTALRSRGSQPSRS